MGQQFYTPLIFVLLGQHSEKANNILELEQFWPCGSPESTLKTTQESTDHTVRTTVLVNRGKVKHHENHWVGGWGRCMQKWRLAPSLDAWGTAGSGQILSCHGSGDFWENWVCVSRNLGELQYRTENFPQIRMPSWRGWGAMGERNFGYLSAQMGSPFMVCIRHSVYLVAALYWEQACTQGLLAWRFLKCRSLLE